MLHNIYKNNFDKVIEQIKNNVIVSDYINDYKLCEICYCSKARLYADGDFSEMVCTDCYYDMKNIVGLYFQHLYG